MRSELGREVAYNLFKIIDQHLAAKKIMEAAPQILRNAVQFLSQQSSDGTTVIDVPAESSSVIASEAKQSREPEVSVPSGSVIPAQAGIQDAHSKKPRPNEPCHCGSGKKFKKCHGK